MLKSKADDYILMRCKIGQVFEHYAVQSECYKRANVARRFVMEDSFYHLSMELLAKIIGPFEVNLRLFIGERQFCSSANRR